MTTYTQADLNEILRKHKLWLADDPSGARAILWGANLTGAILRGADLRGADLTRANLAEAKLTGADLTGADLTRANLWRAILTGADLRRADLTGAILRGADLERADLRRADLWGADLWRADHIDKAKDVNFPIACPEDGSFTAFKKCRDGLIVKLEIPEDALRCSASFRKCRCNKAKVISITNLDGTENADEAISAYDSSFVYKVGEIVSVNNFDENRWNECAPGIHFFITRREAVEY